MRVFFDTLENFPLVCAGSAWILAQIIKVFTGVFNKKEFTVTELLFGSGGMPSSHTAAACALALGCGFKDGFGASSFAISFLLTMIIMRDATGVRRQSGEHARILNQLLRKENGENGQADGKEKQKALKELVGHTPLQVFFGVITGICVTVALSFIPYYHGMMFWIS